MSYLEGAPSRFVLVGTKYESAALDADVAGTNGDVKLLAKTGAGIDGTGTANAGNPLALRLVTDNSEKGATLTSDIVTPFFSAGDVVGAYNQKAYAQPKAHIQELDLGGMTFTAGEVVMMNVRFRNVGAVSDGRYFDVWADHTVSTTTAAAVGAGLVTRWNKTNDKRKVDSATAYMGGTGFKALFASAAKITVTTGSKSVTVTTAADAVANATSSTSQVFFIDGAPYYATSTNGSNVFTLARPYEGQDFSASTAGWTATTDSEADTIYLIGDIQSKVDFNHPFRPIDFDTTMTVDNEEATGLVIVDTQQADIGHGYGPHVAVIEELSLAQFSGLMWTEYRRMRTRRLETSATAQYDQLNFKIRVNTAQYPGSVVNSEAEVTVFIPRDAATNKKISDLADAIADND